MAKKDFFLIVDSETTQPKAGDENGNGAIPAMVADFGGVVCDRKGEIYSQCAVLTKNIFDNPEKTPLFFTSEKNGIWSKNGQDLRYEKYNAMLESGSRMLASINAINRWLEKVAAKYDPFLTAYNLPFDLDKCDNTQIDLTMFTKRFCLWAAAQDKWANTKKYKNFVLECHAFNTPTELGNMTYQTNAEIMTRFVLGMPELPDEPHTALEDVISYELPILVALVKSTKKEKWINAPAYNWRNYQVKNHFTAK
jgi:hypothetical protein